LPALGADMILATLHLLFGISDILQPLEDAMRWLLERFHGAGLPWAWSIVAVTIVVRICLVPLTVKQIHSMQSLQLHAPEMKEIQRKYKGDRQRMNEEMMKFYRENNINPAASCLPLLAQLPVFFALFFVLKDFSKHPPEGPLGWLGIVPSIADKATEHPSGYLLLSIYVLSQVASTWFMSTTMPKAQRYIMLGLPLLFIGVVAQFPVGLVLYWVTTNLWTVGQGLVTRRMIPRTPLAATGPGAKAKKPPEDGRGGNGARREPPKPKPAAPAKAQAPKQQPRTVRKKKGRARK
jgi:YidC/Oxa1 family membrane protein insertase